MSAYRILIADDEASQRSTLAGFLRKKGYETLDAASGDDALKIVQREALDLVLTDLRMPGLTGIELLQKVNEANPEVQVIVMTAYGTVETAVEAMAAGAYTFVQKPVDLNALELHVERALERKLLAEENRELRARMGESDGTATGLIAASEEMREVLGLVARAAPSRASVMILGESGTGKEQVARAIHLGSPRAKKPFVAVNIAAIPETLLESELFGHEKGSFTGASERHVGLFERASGGTLFIDEIGDMPPHGQVKLLRVLQEGTIERVGGTGSIEVDVRIVAATHQKLDELIREKKFREDLFYRLNVVRIEIPPLRQRKADIPPLVDHFVNRFSTVNGKLVKGLDRDALDAVMKYAWPGNVRELENAMESAVVMARSETIGVRDLPNHVRGGNGSGGAGGFQDDDSLSLPDRVEAFERSIINRILEEAGGNQSEAARRLGVSEKAIRYRLKRWEEADEKNQ
ncbi:MAG: sigma-54 dependent transcriptional regulator [bacterium]